MMYKSCLNLLRGSSPELAPGPWNSFVIAFLRAQHTYACMCLYGLLEWLALDSGNIMWLPPTPPCSTTTCYCKRPTTHQCQTAGDHLQQPQSGNSMAWTTGHKMKVKMLLQRSRHLSSINCPSAAVFIYEDLPDATML